MESSHNSKAETPYPDGKFRDILPALTDEASKVAHATSAG